MRVADPGYETDINGKMACADHSFGLPSVKPKPGGFESLDIHEGHYGVPDVMTYGAPLHEDGEIEVRISYTKNKELMHMTMLRNLQGLHAPLRLTMELRAAEKVGRLSFLPSSNFMRDVLSGRDEEIGFEDFLNTAEFREQMGQPHAILEKQLCIL
uniref:Uncharacterized protein n=1 Tax=Timema cristinae TaxID=61476 RepID=A0A7R9D1N7_TIMCR|nr:unnamed protein product [Timema cristinae]